MVAWVAVAAPGGVSPGMAVRVTAFSLAAPLAPTACRCTRSCRRRLRRSPSVAALTAPSAAATLLVLVVAVVALPWLAVKYAPVAVALIAVAALRLWRDDRRRTWPHSAPRSPSPAPPSSAVHRLVYGGWTVYAAGDQFTETGRPA